MKWILQIGCKFTVAPHAIKKAHVFQYKDIYIYIGENIDNKIIHNLEINEII